MHGRPRGDHASVVPRGRWQLVGNMHHARCRPAEAPGGTPLARVDRMSSSELIAARGIHRRIVGGPEQRVPGVAVAGCLQPAGALGGDWWASHALPDGRMLVTIGDVCGHDVAAALIASLARGVLEGLVRGLPAQLDPYRALTTLGEALEQLRPARREMTCCAIALDPAAGTLDLANAGHPFPLVRRVGGGTDVVVTRSAPLASAEPLIGTTRIAVSPGDVILLATDGLSERIGRTGRRFGARRIHELLSRYPLTSSTNVYQLRTDIMEALRSFATTTAADDDLTVVVCEYREQIDDLITDVIDAVPDDVTDRYLA
jgi:serine phosphatase RsbU (regulator of sigma subunit)